MYVCSAVVCGHSRIGPIGASVGAGTLQRLCKPRSLSMWYHTPACSAPLVR